MNQPDMKTKFIVLLFTALLTASGLVRAQDDTNKIQTEIIALLKGLKYQQGEIDLRGGLAKLTVPKEFKYLGPEDAETVLVKLWGNPPSGEKPLGLLIPAGMTPVSSNCWVVTIDYSEDGFVKDDDASKINYDDLLEKMKKGVTEENKLRKERGYPTVNLIGWAAPPVSLATWISPIGRRRAYCLCFLAKSMPASSIPETGSQSRN